MTQLINSDLEFNLIRLEKLFDSMLKTIEVYEANIKEVRQSLKCFAESYNKIVDVLQYPTLKKIDKKMIYG
jgi:hypothetical protein